MREKGNTRSLNRNYVKLVVKETHMCFVFYLHHSTTTFGTTSYFFIHFLFFFFDLFIFYKVIKGQVAAPVFFCHFLFLIPYSFFTLTISFIQFTTVHSGLVCSQAKCYVQLQQSHGALFECLDLHELVCSESSYERYLTCTLQ